MIGEFGYIARTLVRAPVVTIAAVLTIAVAVGGATSVFALFDAAMLRSLPYANADRLVALWVDYTAIADRVGIQDPKREWTNFDNFRDVRARTRTIDDMAAFAGWVPTMTGGEEARRINGAMVSPNGLDVLGVTPQLGRGFIESDGEPGAAGTVMIGHGLWQRAFAGDPAVVGRDLLLNGTGYTVVGVLPPGFRFPFAPDAEIIATLPERTGDRGAAIIRQFGVLAEGATLENAQVELSTIAAALKAEYPDENRYLELFVEPLQDALNLAVRPHLILLQAAGLFVLLVATANLASLMAARASARAGEFTVRESLGATRWRQFRLLWVEGLVLAIVGAAVGLSFTGWGVDALARAFPDGFSQAWDIRLDAKSWIVALAFGAFAGSVIAWVSHAALVRRPTSATGKHVAGQRGGCRLATVLIASNFALALAVTVTGVLLYRSHDRLADAELGFRPDGVLAATVQLSSGAYPDAAALNAAYTRIEERVSGIPGVDSVALSSSIALGVSNTDTGVKIEGRTGARDDGRVQAWYARTTPGYFETMGIRIREGRGFVESDRAEARDVVVVNTAFVREHLGGDPALGVRLNLGSDDQPTWLDIVGVADDVRFFDVSRPQTPSIYIPAWNFPGRGMYVTLRTSREPETMANELRRAISDVDADLALSDLRSMGQRVDAALMVPRTVSRLTLLFAACALLLAAIGVYGTLAQSVGQRTRELGIRRALGALGQDVFRLVLRQGAGPVTIGLALGLPLTYALGRQLQQVLYEITPVDPAAWSFALMILLAVAFCATALPAHRAVRIDPMQALREE